MPAIVLDPTAAYSRRLQQWVERADRYGVTVPIFMSSTLISRAADQDLSAMRPFASTFWLWRGEPVLHSSVRAWPVGSAPDAPSEDDTDRILSETLDAIACGATLVAKRADSMFLFAQLGMHVVVGGRTNFESMGAELRPVVGEQLYGALIRRARFFARVETSGDETTLVFADQGRDAAR